MRRRDFLVALSFPLCLPWARSAGAADCGCDGLALHWRPEATIAGIFTSVDLARALGEAYLRAHPEKAERQVLLAELGLARLPPRSLTDSKIRARVLRLKTAQYTRGDILMVNNWILAPAEACLCGLLVVT